MNQSFDLSFDKLLGILKKNRRSIFQKSLEREFTASLAELTSLLNLIQQTDVLIDQVVYHLYGLTDEASSVVEGVV